MPERVVRHDYTRSIDDSSILPGNPWGIEGARQIAGVVKGKSISQLANPGVWDINWGYFTHGAAITYNTRTFAKAFTQGEALSQRVNSWVDGVFDQHLSPQYGNLPVARLIAKGMARTAVGKTGEESLLTDEKAEQLTRFVQDAITEGFPPEISGRVTIAGKSREAVVSSNDPDIRAVAAMILPDDGFHKDVFPQPGFVDGAVHLGGAVAGAARRIVTGAPEVVAKVVAGARRRLVSAEHVVEEEVEALGHGLETLEQEAEQLLAPRRDADVEE